MPNDINYLKFVIPEKEKPIEQEENEFIYDFFLPRDSEYGEFIIRRIFVPPFFNITFSYHKPDPVAQEMNKS